jgi:UDPglucose 6-dehydrogenase
MYKPSQFGIIGAGYVGSAIQYHFKECKIWDKYVRTPHTLEEVLMRPVIFICLPTPYAKKATRTGQTVFRGADISAQVENLDKFPKGRTAVIKSTIPPGASDYFAKKYPHLNIIFNPEFLTAKFSKEDYAFPDKQILGYTNAKTKKICQDLMPVLPRGQSLIVPAIEAELIKYSINNYYAKNVVFANQLYDVCQKVGADYENVRAGFTMDKRINDSHFGIFHDGYRGYSGACLPKDMKTFIQFAKEQGINLELHKVVDKLNERLLKDGKKIKS